MGFLEGLPIIGGIFDDSDERAEGYLNQNMGLWNKLEVPELTWENLQAESYDPSVAKETTVSEDPMLRSAQLSALTKMAGLAEDGLSDVDQAVFAEARDGAEQMARGNREAVLANAQARGVAGGGMEFALKEIANQEAAKRAQSAGLQQAADSARQRALYNEAYGNMLGGVRQQDYGVNRGNADILNQFNMANTNTRNQGQMYNIDNRQNAFKYNQDGRQGTQQQNFNNQVTKIGGQAGVNTALREDALSESAANAAKRRAIGGGAGTIIGGVIGGGRGAKIGGGIGGGIGDLF